MKTDPPPPDSFPSFLSHPFPLANPRCIQKMTAIMRNWERDPPPTTTTPRPPLLRLLLYLSCLPSGAAFTSCLHHLSFWTGLLTELTRA